MLALNFHKTFIPERTYIAAMLDFAALGKQGTIKEIAAETGIPMGKSSGKTAPILSYAIGMGLIELNQSENNSLKRPVLTPFGQLVYEEDKFLSEEIIQWLAHFNLCRNDIGAKTWHRVFAQGRNILGTSFNKVQLEDFLRLSFGAGKDRTGPLVITYTDDAAFARAGVLSEQGVNLERKKAPLFDYYALSYSSYLLNLWEDFFPKQHQVTLTDFACNTFFFDVCFWSQSDMENFLSLLEWKGYITVDRQMVPWIMEKRAVAAEVWPHIFDDMA